MTVLTFTAAVAISAFPHHENERAQAVALGREFAGHWVHNGFVEVGGEKMSKSLGNFTTLVDLIETTTRGPIDCWCSAPTTAHRLRSPKQRSRRPRTRSTALTHSPEELSASDRWPRTPMQSSRSDRRWTTTWTHPRCRPRYSDSSLRSTADSTVTTLSGRRHCRQLE